MAPSPIPAPLPPWAKAILWLAPVAVGFLEDLLDFSDDTGDGLEWRHCAIRMINTTAASDATQDAYCGLDFVNVTGGNVDTTWSAGDYTTCEAAITTMLTALGPNLPTCRKVSQLRWYKKAFNPMSTSKPFADSGPPDRVTTMDITGTGAPHIAPQVAMSITERTPWPKHWGRFYWPYSAGDTRFQTNQRFQASVVDAAATAVADCYEALADDDFFAVVPVTQVDKVAARGLLVVTEVQVDDVPDVIRRRRHPTPVFKSIKPV